MARAVAFDTTVTAMGNNTGIVVPADVIERLGAGKRPSVVVNVNGYEYRNTVGVMGGKSMVSISAAVRKETGLKGGDPIHVTLTVATTPREVNIPDDFAAALKGDKTASAFFAKLSNSLQRYHADLINGAKTDETRQRRIEKAVALFKEGKQRVTVGSIHRWPQMSTDSDAAGAAPWVMELGSRDVILSEAKDLSVDEEPHTV